jgi:hypothetical protein
MANFTPQQFNTLGRSGALGGIGAGIGNLFADFNNPADAAMPYLDNISNTISPYYQPYINAGQQALPQLTDAYSGLMKDPTALANAIGQKYQPSPGYQFSVDQATKAANQAAAAGGMVGSPAEQQQLASTVTGLANQDYYNFLDRMLGLYGQGLGGLSNINNMGFGASTSLADNLASAILSQAKLAYAGAQNENEHEGGMWGSLFGSLGSAIPFF